MSPPVVRSGDGWRLELELLNALVRVESRHEAFVRGLARCFRDLGTPGPDVVTEPTLRVEVLHNGVGAQPYEFSVAAFDPGPVDGFPAVAREPLDVCSSINEWVARSATRFYVFHAAAVCRGRRALLMPAGSRAGKTTLTAALVQCGFDLLSDEVGAVNPIDLRIAAYPRCLSLRSDVLEVLGVNPTAGYRARRDASLLLEPSALGGQEPEDDAELSMIVVPRFRRDCRDVRLESVRASNMIVELLRASCSQPRFKVAGLDWLIDVVRRVPCYAVEYADVHRAAQCLVSEFELRVLAATSREGSE